MASIFTKIIQGEIPCYEILRNENCIAFLDINPLQKGHTLVVPTLEVDKFFDLPIDVINHCMATAHLVAKALEKSFVCDRIGMTVIGLEVPHAHIHLIPINQMNDMNFHQPKLLLTGDEFQEIANSVRQHLSV